MFGSEKIMEKWSPIMEHADLPRITDGYRAAVTAVVLENQEKALREERMALNETAVNATGPGSAGWDPVLISLVRRAMPNLIAYDIAGVQPMSGPTGLIFAMRSKYNSQNGDEALFNEANTAFSSTTAGNVQTHTGDSSLGSGTVTAGAFVTGATYEILTAGDTDYTVVGAADSNVGTVFVATGAGTGTGTAAETVSAGFSSGSGMSTADAESLGTGGGNEFGEMAFSIEKATVTAKSRALKAEYTIELAQDLKAIHGLDAESELANILSAEVLAEMNREVIRTINSKAKLGCRQGDLSNAGIFDLNTDADGRWSVEKYKGLIVQLDREANVIAKETRRGKGNFIICSSDVATALAASGTLDYAPAISSALQVDDTGNTYAGMLMGRMKVYIDPYATDNYITVGYRGSNPYDAGMFYCPYVPLSMVRAVGEKDFQPRIGFKTRYGMVANPFVGQQAGNDTGVNRQNQYFRIFRVDNILGEG